MSTTCIRRRVADDRGSLPIALLAVVMVSGLITVLTSTVVMGQRQASFDQSFEQALPAAEVGLNRAIYLIESGGVQPPSAPAGEASVMFDSGTQATDNGETYRVTATWLRTPRRWELRSEGTAADGTMRAVTTEVGQRSLFGTAAFGKLFADFNGGNGVDSYRSGTLGYNRAWTAAANGSDICLWPQSSVAPTATRADPFASSDSSVGMCTPWGQASVGTNGELFLKGGVIDRIRGTVDIHFTRDAAHIAPLAPMEGATGWCKGVTATCTSAKLRYHREPNEIEFDPVELPEVISPTGDFPGSNPTPAPFADAGPRHVLDRVSTPLPCVPAGVTPAGARTNCLGSGVYAFNNVTLSSLTDIQGTPSNPTIVYITGSLVVPNGAVVNFAPTAAGRWVPRPSPSLLIFSKGAGPALDFGNHASISAGIHAPGSAFVGGAQGNVYGALVAGSINNNGGWNFHFDHALAGVTVNAPLRADNWAEQS